MDPSSLSPDCESWGAERVKKDDGSRASSCDSASVKDEDAAEVDVADFDNDARESTRLKIDQGQALREACVTKCPQMPVRLSR